MKIDGTNRVGAVNKYQKTHDSFTATSSGKAGKKKDQVEISTEAKELLGSHSPASADHSREQIDALKSSVAAGTYKVDARILAEKLLPFIR
ncbi:flagellar biosynthesis anti-sigma factor FlgM [Paenibacillus piri]|uniref:Negative regulator of flagellin synthesis n=1 Tax=Paenibacillus piri TaxID=2547395 RepID=A0A4R5KEX6_9BACL|nr:flagellar biosynthesis anti-sigma factor FlgM [Paenibacillus piri]TDF93512.1 flagellar biosynthesis anti-sigma factor FlgM [Paenibacillus piri]